MNERQSGIYGELLSADFTFVDETTAIRSTGKEREQAVVDRITRTYRGIYFGLYGDVREETDDGCLVVCGVVQMRLIRDHEPDFRVNDETCLTACPNRADELWHLTEWRLVQSVPLERNQEGFELVTWGDIRRRP